MITDINSEDRAVQQTFAEYLESELGWDSLYGWNQENFGPDSILGRSSERDGVPVTYRDDNGRKKDARARVINFRDPSNNRFLVVRELKIQGLRSPHYNRRADLVCFVNGLPLVFIELKNVWTDIRNGFLVVSNGDEDEMAKIDKLFDVIPMPPYTEDDAQAAAERVYQYIWQRSATGAFPSPVAA